MTPKKPKGAILPFDRFIQKILRRLIKNDFRKKPSLLLVNGLAEQYESWYFNTVSLAEHFVLHVPNLYLYDKDSYLAQLSKISVKWIAERLVTYLDSFAEKPPYYFVGSSSGCQTIATLGALHPELAAKIVLICPSGLGGDENLPVIDGVSKRDLASMIGAIFHNRKDFVIDEIVQILKERFDNKKWRLGFIRMAQVTKRNNISSELLQLKCPVLFICGENDQIIPIWQAYEAVRSLRDHHLDVRMIVIPKCGHAPQIECSQAVNKYIREFLIGKLFTKQIKHRFFRQEGGVLIPFDLDRATENALAKRKTLEFTASQAPLP